MCEPRWATVGAARAAVTDFIRQRAVFNEYYSVASHALIIVAASGISCRDTEGMGAGAHPIGGAKPCFLGPMPEDFVKHNPGRSRAEKYGKRIRSDGGQELGTKQLRVMHQAGEVLVNSLEKGLVVWGSIGYRADLRVRVRESKHKKVFALRMHMAIRIAIVTRLAMYFKGGFNAARRKLISKCVDWKPVDHGERLVYDLAVLSGGVAWRCASARSPSRRRHRALIAGCSRDKVPAIHVAPIDHEFDYGVVV
nr:hypothetical protein [Sinorhizobium meliloti]